MPSHLPFEVVEKILLFLLRIPPVVVYGHQNPDLLACALVSRIWSGVARRHMWDLGEFVVPQSERKLTTLKRLCASPLCSLQLDKVGAIMADPHNPLLTSFFEWCPPFFSGTIQIYLKPPPLKYKTATLTFAQLPSLKILRLHNIRLTSTETFYKLLSSLKGLEYLECHDVGLEHREMEEPDKLLMTPNIRILNVDYGSFFELFYRRVVLNDLRELIFKEVVGNCSHSTRRINSDTHRWSDIGDMLAYTGRHLVRLKLTIYRKIAATSHVDFPIVMDLPTKTPMLRRLEIDIQVDVPVNANKLLPLMLSFKQPHPHLSILKIRHLPDNTYAFDRILERSTPHLQALLFSVPHVVRVKKDLTRAELDIKLRHVLKEGSPEGNMMRKYMSDLGNSMTWCERKQCLLPMFRVKRSTSRAIYPICGDLWRRIGKLNSLNSAIEYCE